MKKKGQGLPLNTVVVAVLVILVLVVVVIFFLGGMGGLTSKIKTMFSGAMAGTDEAIAVQTCHTRCDQAKLLPNPAGSAYCESSFNIDRDNDGEADYVEDGDTKKYKKFYCNIGYEDEEKVSLNVPCIDKKGKQIICI